MALLAGFFASGISIIVAVICIFLIFKIAKAIFRIVLGVVALGAAVYLVVNVFGLFTAGCAAFGIMNALIASLLML